MKLVLPKSKRATPALVDADTEQRLVDLGLTSFRQSDLSRYRQCPYNFKLSKLGVEDRVETYNTLHTLLGSIFHAAIYYDNEAEEHGSNPEWYMHLADRIREANPNQRWMHHGQPLTRSVLHGVCVDLVKKLDVGMLAVKVMTALKLKGYTITGQELYLEHKAGRLTFTGTADMLCVDKSGNSVLLDVKTSGLWDPIIRNQSVKGKDLSYNDVAYHAQLTHYRWLVGKCKGLDVKYQGIILPANGVPLQKASGKRKAGQDRGNILVTAPCEQVNYEQLLVGWLKSISSNNFYKSFPEVFGKSQCFQCSNFAHCRGADAMHNNTVVDIDEGEW